MLLETTFQTEILRPLGAHQRQHQWAHADEEHCWSRLEGVGVGLPGHAEVSIIRRFQSFLRVQISDV